MRLPLSVLLSKLGKPKVLSCSSQGIPSSAKMVSTLITAYYTGPICEKNFTDTIINYSIEDILGELRRHRGNGNYIWFIAMFLLSFQLQGRVNYFRIKITA